MTIEDKETVFIDENLDRICCDGTGSGNNGNGHPKVYYSLEDKDHATCHYCSKVFVKKTRAANA